MTRSDHAAVLMRELAGRIIDISVSGCLIESRRRLEIGTVGRLRLKFSSEECADDVEVVRCERVGGARSTYHVGVRFLWTAPREAGTIRAAVTRHAGDVDTARVVWLM